MRGALNIVGYKVLEAMTTKDLVEMVEASLGYGWEPYGPLTVVPGVSKPFIQPMIKQRGEGCHD